MIRPGTAKAIRGMAHRASRTPRKGCFSCGVIVLLGVAGWLALTTYAVWLVIA